MSLIAAALVFIVANFFIQGNPVSPVASDKLVGLETNSTENLKSSNASVTSKPNGTTIEDNRKVNSSTTISHLLRKLWSASTQKPGWWHYRMCMGQPCALKRI
uniref:Secreted protein n=1 Tax=Haemonchus contortus TaxID=6289 RepID=A0A7I4YW70_HAECO|nr:unnamed protein product [Haemonchus contortus]